MARERPTGNRASRDPGPRLARPATLSVLAALLIAVPGPALSGPGSGDGGATACELGFYLDGFDRYTTRGAGAVLIDFEVPDPLTARFYYAVSFGWSDPGSPIGEVREGALATRILETGDGEILNHAAVRLFPSGTSATVGGDELELGPDPGEGCGYFAAGGLVTLGPGRYRLVVLGGADHGSEFGALVPSEIAQLTSSTVEASSVVPAGGDCQALAGVATPGPQATTSLACTRTHSVGEGRAYWVLSADRAASEDPFRQGRWITPDEGPKDLAGFLVGGGGPGEYALEVDHWIGASGPRVPRQLPSPGLTDAWVAGLVASG